MGNVTPITAARPRVLEFFAGIGLARMGLEEAGFHVAWANDYSLTRRRCTTRSSARRPTMRSRSATSAR